jgi:hypothetical protein
MRSRSAPNSVATFDMGWYKLGNRNQTFTWDARSCSVLMCYALELGYISQFHRRSQLHWYYILFLVLGKLPPSTVMQEKSKGLIVMKFNTGQLWIKSLYAVELLLKVKRESWWHWQPFEFRRQFLTRLRSGGKFCMASYRLLNWSVVIEFLY